MRALFAKWSSWIALACIANAGCSLVVGDEDRVFDPGAWDDAGSTATADGSASATGGDAALPVSTLDASTVDGSSSPPHVDAGTPPPDASPPPPPPPPPPP